MRRAKGVNVFGCYALAGLALMTAGAGSGCSRQSDEPTATLESPLTVPLPTVSQFVVLASRAASFGARTAVTGGSVGVAASATATLGSITATNDSRIAVGQVLVSQSITVQDRAVTGEIGANQLNISATATTGPRSAFVAPPAQPVPGTVTPGTTAVNVAGGQTMTLAAGRFGAVGVDGTLNLSGGLYELQSLRLGVGARVNAQARTIVRVAGGVTAADRSRFAPVAPLRAGDLRLIVAGTIDANNTAVSWGVDGQLTALVVARGVFRAADRLVASGAIAGLDVILGNDSTLAFDSGFPCGSNASCNDNNACTADACVDVQCVLTPVANGTTCSDGNACTQTDTCQAGACVGANPVVCRATDQCHVAGVCSPATGACSNPAAANGTACNDANACTRTDTCQAGACVGANPVACTASDQCHVAGTCNPTSGVCSNPNAANGTTCNDGNACTQTDSCQTGACVGANPVTCAASDQCHVAGTCSPITGACSNPVAPNGTTCSDGSACTRTDTCQAGACVGANPVTCAASDQCHDAGTCNPASGICSNPPRANGSACDDNNRCTQGDSCQAGACVGGPGVTCSASDQCHDPGTCNPITGACSNPARADGSSCSDGNACTRADACQAGACVGGSAVTCAASDQCHTAGACNPATGTCSNPVAEDGDTCNDGNACTQGDHCQVGACVGRTSTTCTASDQCHTAGTCDPGTGVCSSPPKPDGTSCDDGNICGMGATCQEGSCSGGSQSVVTEMPTGVAQPSAITAGGDHALWFISPESLPGAADGTVVRMDPSTRTFTRFSAGRTLTDIAWGADGNLWLGERAPSPVGPLSALGRMTAGGVFLPDLLGFPTQYVAAAPDGTVWFADTVDTINLLEAIPTSGSTLLAGLAIPTNATRGITAGPDGNIWIIESHGGVGPAAVARIAPPGGIKEFPVATTGDLNGIAAGPDGNLWFTDAGRNEIGRITPAGVITMFPIPTLGSGPDGITAGPDGNLWFTERVANKIASITPAGVITELSCALTAGSRPTSIVAGPDGNVWFTETAAGNVGSVKVLR